MVLLGLLLLILSGAAVALLAIFNGSGGPTYSVELFGNEVAVVNAWQIFAAGVVAALAFSLGLWMVSAGGRRRRVLRSEVKAARHDAEAAATERDRLAEQLDKQQETTTAASTAPPAEVSDQGRGRHRFGGILRRERSTTT